MAGKKSDNTVLVVAVVAAAALWYFWNDITGTQNNPLAATNQYYPGHAGYDAQGNYRDASGVIHPS